VPGPEAVHNAGVVFGTLVGIVDDQPDGAARGFPFKHTGQDLHFVGLAALGGMARFTGLAPVQVTLKIRLGQHHTGWTTIHDTTNGRAVTFTEAGNCKEFSDAVP